MCSVMRVRKAEVGDAEDINRVLKESWLDAYEGIHSQEALDEVKEIEEMISVEDLKDSIQDDSSLYLVGEIDGCVKSEMIIELEGDENLINYSQGEVFLKSAYVEPQAQGKGLGTSMLEKLLEELPENTNSIKTMVLAENSDAKGFYESKGFKKTGKSSIGGGEGSLMEYEHETVIMRKDLE